MKNNKKGIDLGETFKQGVGGGILGAFVGAPGLGMAAGVLHANKDKVKQFVSDVDNTMTPQQTRQRVQRRDCPYKKKEKPNRPMDDPASYF